MEECRSRAPLFWLSKPLAKEGISLQHLAFATLSTGGFSISPRAAVNRGESPRLPPVAKVEPHVATAVGGSFSEASGRPGGRGLVWAGCAFTVPLGLLLAREKGSLLPTA